MSELTSTFYLNKLNNYILNEKNDEYIFEFKIDGDKIMHCENSIKDIVNNFNKKKNKNIKSKDQLNSIKYLKQPTKNNTIPFYYKYTNIHNINLIQLDENYEKILPSIKNYIIENYCDKICIKNRSLNMLRQILKLYDYNNQFLDELYEDYNKNIVKYNGTNIVEKTLNDVENYLKNKILEENINNLNILIKNIDECSNYFINKGYNSNIVSILLLTINNYVNSNMINYLIKNNIKIHSLCNDDIFIYKNSEININDLHNYLLNETGLDIHINKENIKNELLGCVNSQITYNNNTEDSDYHELIKKNFELFKYEGKVYVYEENNNIWSNINFQQKISEFLRQNGVKTYKKENSLLKMCYNHATDFRNFKSIFNDTNKYIPFKSKVFDIKNKKFIDFSSELYFTKTLDYDVDIDKILNKDDTYFKNSIYYNDLKNILKDSLDFFILAITNHLIFEIDDHFIFFFIGTGSNGKSVLIYFLSRSFDFMYKNGDINRFYSNSTSNKSSADPELVDFQCKKIISYSEPNPDKKMDINALKFLSGDSKNIEARGLYNGEYKKLQLKFMIIFACNEFPKFDRKDEASDRRIVSIKFSSKFIDDETYNHHKKYFEENKNLIDEKYVEDYIVSKNFSEEYKKGMTIFLMEFILHTLIHKNKGEKLIIPNHMKSSTINLRTPQEIVIDILNDNIIKNTPEDIQIYVEQVKQIEGKIPNYNIYDYINLSDIILLYKQNLDNLQGMNKNDFIKIVEDYYKQDLAKNKRIYYITKNDNNEQIIKDKNIRCLKGYKLKLKSTS